MTSRFLSVLTAAAAVVASACSQPAPRNVLYVTNERAGTLTMIDVDGQEPIGTIQLGKRPRGIVVSPDRTRLYVALSGSPIAGPGVDESTLPPPDKGADGIGEVDATAHKLLRVLRAGSDPEGLALSKDGTQAFIANEDTAQLSTVQLSDGSISATCKVGA
jgi:YVTN family beta-propeller protein